MFDDSLTECSDEELAKMTRAGNQDALSTLVNRYSSLAHDLSFGFSVNCSHNEDYSQEALLSLVNAAYTYDENKNALFKTYATACMKNRLIDIYRRDSKRTDISSLEANLDLPSQSQLQDDYETKEQLDKVVENISVCLSDDERKVILLTLYGLSVAQIAERTGKTAKSVSNALFRARKKLKQSILIG